MFQEIPFQTMDSRYLDLLVQQREMILSSAQDFLPLPTILPSCKKKKNYLYFKKSGGTVIQITLIKGKIAVSQLIF